jgi:hypothetical protein
LTIAVDARDAKDFSRSHIERERTHAPTGEAIDREPDRALRHRARRVRRCDVATDHHRREFAPRHVADARGSGDAPKPQNDNAVASIEDFRQLVGDEHNAFPFGAEPSED